MTTRGTGAVFESPEISAALYVTAVAMIVVAIRFREDG